MAYRLLLLYLKALSTSIKSRGHVLLFCKASRGHLHRDWKRADGVPNNLLSGYNSCFGFSLNTDRRYRNKGATSETCHTRQVTVEPKGNSAVAVNSTHHKLAYDRELVPYICCIDLLVAFPFFLRCPFCTVILQYFPVSTACICTAAHFPSAGARHWSP